jgi:hypothetical protein
MPSIERQTIPSFAEGGEAISGMSEIPSPALIMASTVLIWTLRQLISG